METHPHMQTRSEETAPASPLARAQAPLLFLLLTLSTGGCAGEPSELTPEPTRTPVTRSASIPSDADKGTPVEDPTPPILHAEGWSAPVPLEGPVNTAGAEDAPFISSDGEMLFFFFTPDVRVPAEKQLLDGVTGIYLSMKEDRAWGQPQRVWLQEPGRLALDGCPAFHDEVLWFCTAREGLTGLQWFTAKWSEGTWSDWRIHDFDPSYQVGELHIHAEQLYFHSARPGGQGGNDLWMARKVADEWGSPVNIEAVNSPEEESRPFLTQDGQQLWFTRSYQGSPAIFRSLRVAQGWGSPQLILSQFAGEPTLDPTGNIYFVHHYYEEGRMIEADIYVAYRQ